MQQREKAIKKYQCTQSFVGVDDFKTALFCVLYYQEKQDNSRSQALRKAQFKLRNLTGDELSAKYKGQLEDYFEQQKGEQQVEIVKNVRRLDLLCRETLHFGSPHYWAGFVSQGLAQEKQKHFEQR
ncbi:CHAT domain-containing protein [Microcoleus sp. F8-D3]